MTILMIFYALFSLESKWEVAMLDGVRKKPPIHLFELLPHIHTQRTQKQRGSVWLLEQIQIQIQIQIFILKNRPFWIMGELTRMTRVTMVPSGVYSSIHASSSLYLYILYISIEIR